MIVERPHYYQARVTLEAMSAHAIHSGRGDLTHDTLLVRDANGLPTLPGSSLTGVLRHQYLARHGATATNALFGAIGEVTQPSWLTVGWGLVHDSHDHAREGLQPEANDDPLLAALLADKPLVRQRVRLNARGSAADTGKFDVTLVPAGVRYTTLLGYWCDGSDSSRAQWQQLLALLQSPGLRLGHGTRQGQGRFAVVSLHVGHWELTTREGREGYARRPRRRADCQGLQALPLTIGEGGLHLQLALRADAGWRVGGGELAVAGTLPAGQQGDVLLPQHETCVRWREGRATIVPSVHLLPGSAIKGALRHRTAYHYRCLTGEFVSAEGSLPEDCPALDSLFGCSSDDESRAGLVLISDLALPDTVTQLITHNRIDRFTGGVIRGGLFTEQVLWQTPLSLRIELIEGDALHAVAATVRRAFALALEDLCQGWLPLGAGGSRGLGVFTSEADPLWSDSGAWVEARDSKEQAA